GHGAPGRTSPPLFRPSRRKSKYPRRFASAARPKLPGLARSISRSHCSRASLGLRRRYRFFQDALGLATGIVLALTRRVEQHVVVSLDHALQRGDQLPDLLLAL